MATFGFQRVTGAADVRSMIVDSSSVIAIGDLVSTDESAGDLIVGATNIANAGVAQEASASGSTTAIKYDRLTPGSVWRARVETGTAALSEVGKFADINTQDGITLTESNNDCRVINWNGVAGFLDVEFTTTEQLGPTTV